MGGGITVSSPESEGGKPSQALLETYKQFPTSILSDALDRMNCMHSGLKALVPESHICGPALTVRCYPGDNLMCHYAVHKANPGDVLVVDGAGYTEGAIWGALLSRSAAVRGLGGTVIDGAARDRVELRTIGYPVYARAVTPRGVFKTRRGEINVPVSCGGLAVSPGDLIVGDEDGIVVVPCRLMTQVAEKASQILAKEKEMTACIERGQTLYDFLGLGKLFGE